MKLSLWTYEGPPHVGAMRIATSMNNAHYVLHAPQGDTYADLLFTMIERQGRRPPVTYTTFQARDLGKDTAGLFVDAVRESAERFDPEVLFVGESCTAELIQDQPGSLTLGMNLPMPVVPLELPAYSRKENYGASETFYQLVRTVLRQRDETESKPVKTRTRPLANVLGASALGFRCRDDIIEIERLLATIGVDINVVAPLDAALEDIRKLPDADLNICLYPEVAQSTCDWLKRQFKQPVIDIVPIGVGATHDFIRAVGEVAGVDVSDALRAGQSRLPWYSRSVDSNYLTGKRVFIFGDATHAIAAARVASEELGFDVVGLGTYSREFARDVRVAAKDYGVEPLITDDYLEVEQCVRDAEPELVLGTQMERHIAKRLGVPCAVISAPFHVEDCPARYSPQMGYEGANVIFDTWVHPLMMGLEEHLLGMFRDDFEFNDRAAPSHLGNHADTAAVTQLDAPAESPTDGLTAIATEAVLSWTTEAERELRKVPFFVRTKARRNTERYAEEFGLHTVTVETLYDAKAHFSR